MSNSPGTITSVRWSSLFPWLLLVRAARVSLMFRVLGLALAGLLITQAGWRIVDGLVLNDADSSAIGRANWPVEFPNVALPQPLPASATFPSPAGHVAMATNQGLSFQFETIGGPLVHAWTWVTEPFRRLLLAHGFWRWLGLLLDSAWTIVVWALFGGAIARIAALYIAHGETIGPAVALKSAARRWPSFAGAPVIAIIALVLLAIPLMLAGLMARASFLAVLLGLIWFVVLLGALLIALVGIGLALGWPLMAASVAVERTDAFDGISRAYAYVYQRPLHAFLFVVFAGLLGLLGQAAVNVVVGTTLDATHWAVAVGAGHDRAFDLFERSLDLDRDQWSSLTRTAARLVRFWDAGFESIALAFPLAYLWSTAVGVYLLLRRHIDATDVSEVKFDEGDPRPGLPSLATDIHTGVPQVAEPTNPAQTPPSASPNPPAP
jgi:hypothetical protein